MWLLFYVISMHVEDSPLLFTCLRLGSCFGLFVCKKWQCEGLCRLYMFLSPFMFIRTALWLEMCEEACIMHAYALSLLES